jgi:hypothetical protein
MENTSGFYKWDNVDNKWWWAPTAVYSPAFTIKRELKDTYEYPVDGWTWYDERPADPETI